MESNDYPEKYVLGAMLHSSEAVEKIIPILQARDFQVIEHRHIFEVMAGLYEGDKPIDIATVAGGLYEKNWLKSIGGRAALMGLMEAVPGEIMATHYANKVKNLSIAFKARQKALKFIADFAELSKDTDKMLSDLISELSELQARTIKSNLLSMPDIAVNTNTELENLKDRKTKGINTGFSYIDSRVGGFFPGELITIAGVTGVGKTNLTLQFADHIAYRNQIPVLYIPLEMTANSLFKRLVLGHAETLTGYALRSGDLSDSQWLEWTKLSTKMSEAKIYIPDKMEMKFSDIPALIQKAKTDFNIQAVFIDYLQLLGADGRFESESAKVRYISRTLKMTAINKRICLFVVSQFRKLNNRQKAPGLDDLYGSVGVSQDSDFAIFIHREYESNDSNKFKAEGFIELSKGRDAEAGAQSVIFKHPRYYEIDNIHNQ